MNSLHPYSMEIPEMLHVSLIFFSKNGGITICDTPIARLFKQLYANYPTAYSSQFP